MPDIIGNPVLISNTKNCQKASKGDTNVNTTSTSYSDVTTIGTITPNPNQQVGLVLNVQKNTAGSGKIRVIGTNTSTVYWESTTLGSRAVGSSVSESIIFRFTGASAEPIKIQFASSDANQFSVTAQGAQMACGDMICALGYINVATNGETYTRNTVPIPHLATDFDWTIITTGQTLTADSSTGVFSCNGFQTNTSDTNGTVYGNSTTVQTVTLPQETLINSLEGAFAGTTSVGAYFLLVYSFNGHWLTYQ